MKRINILLTAIICFLSTSCSKMTFEEKAVSRVNVILDKMESYESIESVKLLNQETIYSGDSICVINLDIYITETSGRAGLRKMEYVLFWSSRYNLFSVAYPIDKNGKNLLEDVFETENGNVPSDKNEYERHLRAQIALYNYFRPDIIRDINVPED